MKELFLAAIAPSPKGEGWAERKKNTRERLREEKDYLKEIKLNTVQFGFMLNA